MDPYYPIPRVQNAELYTRYHALTLPNVHFSGRLATYCNMDQVVSFGPPGAPIFLRSLY
jgi:UDP-galactopyranose mutase